MRYMLMTIGCIAVFLGVIGIVLPLLPTTPFLLLAASCFAKSSPRFHSWLLNHPLLGPYLRLYLSGAGLPLRAKKAIISVLWLSILTSAIFLITYLPAKVIVLFIALCVTIYILRLPTAQVEARIS